MNAGVDKALTPKESAFLRSIYSRANCLHPKAFFLRIDGRCNQDCDFCNILEEGGSDFTSPTGYIKKMLRQIVSVKPHDAVVNFTGGEPTLRKDLVMLRHWKVGPGSRVAVAGLGGLGHMGVKLAVGLGAEVTVVTTSPAKSADALALGAHKVLIASDKEAMKAARGSFDLVLDTIPVAHDISPYLMLLAPRGVHVIVGAIDMLPSLHSGLLVGGQKSVAGSAIGGLPETQELLDFCAAKTILPDTETIAIQDINHAFERMEKADVKYRFVIDMASLGRGS